MRQLYKILLAVCIVAIAAAFLFMRVGPLGSVLFAFSLARIDLPFSDIHIRLKWVLVPGILLGGWCAIKLREPVRGDGNGVSAQRDKVNVAPTPKTKASFRFWQSPIRSALGIAAIVSISILIGPFLFHGRQVLLRTIIFSAVASGALVLLRWDDQFAKHLRPVWLRIPPWLRDRIKFLGYLALPAIWAELGGGVDWPGGVIAGGLFSLGLWGVCEGMYWWEKRRARQRDSRRVG